jgi:hypothetical protein
MKHFDQILTGIAREQLLVPTLETRRSDALDFHEIAVWQLKLALEAAFDAGARSIPRVSESTPGLPVPFDDYEIHGVKRFTIDPGREEQPLGVGALTSHYEQVDDAGADFWSLFGHIPGQGLDCIGDFATREHAEEILARIIGRRYANKGNQTAEG